MHSDNENKNTNGDSNSEPTKRNEANHQHQPLGEPPRPPGWILDDPDVIEQIDLTAHKLSKRCGHSSSDLEDIKQDIRLHLFQKESAFNPDRGTPGAYANCILRTWLWTKLRYLKQQRRKGRMYRRPLSRVELPPDQDGLDQASSPVEAADLLKTYLSRFSQNEVWLLRLVLEHGQERAAVLLGIKRRELRHRLCFIRTTCSDLHSFSEKAARP